MMKIGNHIYHSVDITAHWMAFVTGHARILITGDRDWQCEQSMHTIFSQCDVTAQYIHGNCRGADRMAHTTLLDLGVLPSHIHQEPAQWQLHGKRRAGPIRNKKMFDVYHPTLILAFHADIGRSKGTSHMIEYSRSQSSATQCTIILIESAQKITEILDIYMG